MNRLQAIRQAQKITDRVFAEIRQFIHAGLTEKQVAAKIQKLIIQRGGDRRLAFQPIVCSGQRTALFHGPTSKKKIQKNDIIYIDMGARYKGYCSDLTRTFFLGQPDRRLQKIYKIVLAAQKKQIRLVKAGASIAAIDRAGRDFFQKHKLAKYFTHTTGHGVGLKIHEPPTISYKSPTARRTGQDIVNALAKAKLLSPKKLLKSRAVITEALAQIPALAGQDTLQAGQVITIEPGLYIKGLGGVRIEDMLIVTKNGCVNLSKSPK
ncbi:MAG: M24 family metallopeptidase [Candidatus Margulisbacteria bacterium]|jgi:Xaa-Pro aminopeptidase|nr:M24 family metallopeptidase [Candidatus Margulisiibacteriota bacterium]